MCSQVHLSTSYDVRDVREPRFELDARAFGAATSPLDWEKRSVFDILILILLIIFIYYLYNLHILSCQVNFYSNKLRFLKKSEGLGSILGGSARWSAQLPDVLSLEETVKGTLRLLRLAFKAVGASALRLWTRRKSKEVRQRSTASYFKHFRAKDCLLRSSECCNSYFCSTETCLFAWLNAFLRCLRSLRYTALSDQGFRETFPQDYQKFHRNVL